MNTNEKLREALKKITIVCEKTPTLTYQKMESIAKEALAETAEPAKPEQSPGQSPGQSPAEPAVQEPYAYVYEFDHPFLGVHRSFSSASRNGSAPSRCVKVYTHPTLKAVQPDFSDAYQGAREDAEIWKKRALEAEELNRKFIAQINDETFMGEPAQPVRKLPRLTNEEIDAAFSEADKWCMNDRRFCVHFANAIMDAMEEKAALDAARGA